MIGLPLSLKCQVTSNATNLHVDLVDINANTFESTIHRDNANYPTIIV